MSKISAVIPTIGRVETLPSVLLSLKFQSEPIDEVIILDEADTPICEAFAVSQAIDLLSLSGVTMRIIRNRRRKGIGHARYFLAEESVHESVLMVDDDVILNPNCLQNLLWGEAEYREKHKGKSLPWTVPTCILIPKIEADGYSDKIVDMNNPRVSTWTERYPWFVPYFKYSKNFIRKLPCAGTQAILLDRDTFLGTCGDISRLGILPREDTYMTVKMGEGLFVSNAECYHMEHQSQKNRGEWNTSMFYRIHEAILNDPDAFMQFLGD